MLLEPGLSQEGERGLGGGGGREAQCPADALEGRCVFLRNW